MRRKANHQLDVVVFGLEDEGPEPGFTDGLADEAGRHADVVLARPAELYAGPRG